MSSNGVLSECVTKLSDEDVKFLHPRLAQRLSGDIAGVLLRVENIADIDQVFASAENADQLYDAIDTLAKEVEKEFRKRPHLMVEDKPEKKQRKVGKKPFRSKKPYNKNERN